MQEEPVTVARWDWWRGYNARSRRDRALKCLFLNRTTFSGILHGRAGPIGGRKQESAYKIDCRFGIGGLTRRIRAVGDLADAGRLMDVWNVDWRMSLARARSGFPELSPDEIAVYLDPPYVDKAPELYEWSFNSDEHAALARAVRDESGFRWVLSYDDNPTARSLYEASSARSVRTLMYTYTAAGSGTRRTRSELLVTNFTDVPITL
jgi:DNA adenine methylase